uniref:Uncharacterized protein n=1 Tax=Anguilla anguilla TaxID=7936 RepID=A0A0E9S9X2_ANGAN
MLMQNNHLVQMHQLTSNGLANYSIVDWGNDRERPLVITVHLVLM